MMMTIEVHRDVKGLERAMFTKLSKMYQPGLPQETEACKAPQERENELGKPVIV